MKRVFAVFTTALILLFPLQVKAACDPTSYLAEAVTYWQEKAVEASGELNLLRAENQRLSAENEALKADLKDADKTIYELREIINDMAIQNEKTNSLRIQAENDLNTVLEQVKVLEEAIKKLSGPKFGALIGATYTNGEYGVMAGVTMSLK